jgi:hypothetical protein
MPRKPYPTDVSDEEWSFAAPYFVLMTQDAPQREHSLREVFNALRWIVRAGSPWRLLPNDFPPWEAVYQQSRRWLEAGCFEAIGHGPALDDPFCFRPPRPAQCGGSGRAYLAVELRERPTQRLRRLQAQARQQGAHGRRHAGSLAGRARDAGQRAGASPGVRVVRGRADGHGPHGSSWPGPTRATRANSPGAMPKPTVSSCR